MSETVSVEVALKLLHRLKSYAEKMTQWERELCYDLAHHIECGGKLSNRQYAKLKQFELKYFGS